VLLADDHAIVTGGLQRQLEADFDVVGVARNGRELLRAARALQPDVAVVDISMPLLNGVDATRQLTRRHPALKVVILSMHTDVAYVQAALEAGARGYVAKHAAAEELIQAIDAVLGGRDYLSPLVARPRQAGERGAAARADAGTLTARQREVLQLIAEGRTDREIAALLHLSPRTAEFHRQRVRLRLGLKTTAELVQYAIRHGLVSQ
jgi:DNA-binding NarL/FixJ family response regulator